MPDTPVWDDETLAGSLFPRAVPQRPRRVIARDSTGTPLVIALAGAMRANHDVRLARREEALRREASPEEREERWRAAGARAREEVRRERRQGRIAAGIETAPKITINLEIDAEAMKRLSGAFEGMAKAYVDAIRPGLERFAHACVEIQKASISREQRDALARIVAAAPRAAAKPPPPRERYLPGTRHAPKGQRR